jgi:hypothetical protein
MIERDDDGRSIAVVPPRRIYQPYGYYWRFCDNDRQVCEGFQDLGNTLSGYCAPQAEADLVYVTEKGFVNALKRRGWDGSSRHPHELSDSNAYAYFDGQTEDKAIRARSSAVDRELTDQVA